MAAVESRQLLLAQPLDHCHDRSVDEAQPEVAVAGQKLADAVVVGTNEVDDGDRAVLDVSQERREGLRAEPVAGQPVELDDHGRRNDEPVFGSGQELCTDAMVGVGAIQGGVRRTGVADQRDERGS